MMHLDKALGTALQRYSELDCTPSTKMTAGTVQYDTTFRRLADFQRGEPAAHPPAGRVADTHANLNIKILKILAFFDSQRQIGGSCGTPPQSRRSQK